jgi:predicted O-methyltransferase YrrM
LAGLALIPILDAATTKSADHDNRLLKIFLDLCNHEQVRKGAARKLLPGALIFKSFAMAFINATTDLDDSKLIGKIYEFGDAFYRTRVITNDLYALNFLKPLLAGPYLAYTNSTIRPQSLAFILNDLVVNERRSMIEFGTGISTLLIGRLIKLNGLGTRVVTVEHDLKWKEVIDRAIDAEKLGDFITTIHAPLTECPFSLGSNLWYDRAVLERAVQNRRFDAVLVDGPPAYEPRKKEARYPALPFIFDSLAERSIIYLDNADREGEAAILQKWTTDYSISFQTLAGGMAVSIRGEHFNPQLLF